MSLDDDLVLQPRADGGWDCTITENYWIEDGPNGGYIAALLATAAERRVDVPNRQARGLTVHYLRRPRAGPAVLHVETLHEGRSVSFLRVVLEQDQRPVATATGTWAKAREGFEHDAWTMPHVDPPGECPPMASVREDVPLPIHQQWDIRSIAGVPFGEGESTEMFWWIRPPVHRPLDAAMIVAMADALPPPIFAVASPGLGLPTLDLTVHIRTDLESVHWEPGDWIMAAFVTRLAKGGFVEEDGELWTADGTLVANSRQLAITA
jgi:acyl-CoA thioesterase